MDFETVYIQMEQDFEELAKEYEASAENERIWMLGSKDDQTYGMHSANMKQFQLMARMYRRMKEDILSFLETYDDNEEN
jgi:hypothetical protein